MWLAPLPAAPVDGLAPSSVTSAALLAVVLLLPRHRGLRRLKIWNYNKSLLDAVKGVRRAHLLVDGDSRWLGDVAKGSGNELTDHATIINLATAETNANFAPVATDHDLQVRSLSIHGWICTWL